MDQTIINWIIAGAGVVIGMFLKDVLDNIKLLHATDVKHAERLSEIEVLVAGTYIKREEHTDASKALFAKLDRIEQKLDTKVGRDECSTWHSKQQ